MLDKIQKNFESEVKDFAKKNIIAKLQMQGINYLELDDSAFASLLHDEIEILKSDSKKVGAGIGIGIVISLLTGI